MRILCTDEVGSHLETIYSVEQKLRVEEPNLKLIVADIVGFSNWHASHLPYRGNCQRLQFSPVYCGLKDGKVTRHSWQAIKNGAFRVIQENTPDLYLTMEDSFYPEYAFIQSARTMGIRTLLIQEGPFRQEILRARMPKSLRSRLKAVARWLLNRLGFRHDFPPLPTYGLGGCDRIAVVSEHYASVFRAAGVDNKQIVITGVPRFDSYAKMRSFRLGDRKQRRSNTGKRNILLISQPFVRYNELSIEECLDLYRMTALGLNLLAKVLPIKVTVRLHPSETPDDVHMLCSALHCDFAIQMADRPLSEKLDKYDLVVGYYSTGLLEALIIGIPVVCVETMAIHSRTNWFRQAKVPVATSSEELRNLCQKGLNLGIAMVDRSNLLREVGEVDGLASQRVAEVIFEITGRKAR